MSHDLPGTTHVLQGLAECGNTDTDSKSGHPLLLNFMKLYSRIVDDLSQQE